MRVTSIPCGMTVCSFWLCMPRNHILRSPPEGWAAPTGFYACALLNSADTQAPPPQSNGTTGVHRERVHLPTRIAYVEIGTYPAEIVQKDAQHLGQGDLLAGE